MKISQLLLQPHGQKIGGMTLTVKTAKKTTQPGGIWWHQVLFCDEEGGEIPADVKIGKYIPLHSGWKIKIIVAKVKDGEYLGKPRKILVVDQYKVETQMIDDFYKEVDEAYQGEIKIVRSKIKCLLIAQKVGTGTNIEDVLWFTEHKMLDKIIDRIMEG